MSSQVSVTMKSQGDSETSRRTSASSDTMEENNAIRTCIKKYFDAESYAKFQQVLEYVDSKLYVPLFETYNKNLRNQLEEAQNFPFPDGYQLNNHISFKLKFYAFRFISNVGVFLLQKFQAGDEKANEQFIALTKVLLFHALTSKSDTANLALVELEQLCLKRGLTLPTLFQAHRAKFIRLIIKAILFKLMTSNETNNLSNGNGLPENGTGTNWSPKVNCVIAYMTRAFEVFNIASITREDVAQSLIITTNLIHKEIYNDAIKLFLEYLASFQNIDLFVLIRSHIQAIVVSLLLRRKLSHFDMTASLTKLCSFCGKRPSELLANKFTFIKARLLLNYSTDAKIVKDGIYFLSKFEKSEHEQPFEDEFDDEKQFVEYLSPSMIGILLGVDSHFNANHKQMGSPESIKHIESLVKLVSQLDEKQVRVIHVKLLSTLSLLLRLRVTRDNSDLNKTLTKLWSVFVSKLNEDLRVSLLISICVAMFDLVEDCPSEVAHVYEDLLCKETDSALGENLKSLFFIPNSPAFEKIYAHITPYVRREDSVKNLSELQISLDCILPLMKLENNKCKVIALTKMKQLLKSNQNLLISNVLTNLDEPLDPLISRMIESLLALSSTQDSECCALIAECLGILGAVNPIRLDHLIYGEIVAGKPIRVTNLADSKFIIDLIERLKNSLLSDQRSESETASYAIQVVVKTYSVFKDQFISRALSDDALKACHLCENTSYDGIKKIQSDISGPVYEKFKGEYQYSYKEWLDKFYLNLVSTLDNQKLQDVLHACSFIFKYNQKLAEFLLPNVILHIIINQPSHSIIISREIMAILEEDVGVSTQDLDTVYDQEVRGSIQTLHFQCANMVFCTMDALHRLDCDIRWQSSTVHLNQRQNTHLKSFISSIPKDKLAILATKCRSHARALCYLEQHLYITNTSDINRYATTLQRIYMALDDSYEAAGIEMVRTKPTTIADDITNYEAGGRFDKAFACYSTTIDDIGGEIERESFIEDSLRCLSNQGDNQRLYEKSRQLINDYPQYKRSILPAAVEACWKLGKWAELEKTFKSETLDNLLESTSVSQGYLLNSLIQDRRDVVDRLKVVRQRLIKPLSIAMMDRSAYFRGYQNLLTLHSIEDFALSMEVLEQNHFSTQSLDENSVDALRPKLSGSLSDLFSLWNKRNKLVQPSLRSLEPPLAWQRSIGLVLTKKYPFLKQRIDVEIGRMWLKSADIAREAQSFDRSFLCLIQARRWFGSEFHKLNLDLQISFHIEQAKLDWDQGEKTKAIRCLKLSLLRLRDHPLNIHLDDRRCALVKSETAESFPQLNNLQPCVKCNSINLPERESFAKLKMLLTHYSEEAAAGIPETLFYMYEECVHLGVNQEETYFRLARYYDRLLAYYMENPKLCGESAEEKENPSHLNTQLQRFSQNLASGDKEDVYTKLMEHSIIAFGHSLKYGAKHLSESMPRMLNIWYDLGSKKPKATQMGAPRVVSSRIESTVRFIDELKKNLPPYYFMTAISLLLSRVCHPHTGVAKKTCEIIELLLQTYPYQISWMITNLINDKAEDRKRAAKSILASLRKKGHEIEKIVKDTLDFADVLKEISVNYGPCDKNRGKTVRHKEHEELLNRYVKQNNGFATIASISPKASKFDFTKARILPPAQATIRAILPMGHSNENLDKHVVFADHSKFFVTKLLNKVRIYTSVAQPRGITVECENGKSVPLLCKAGDDLRKDSRCIEFFNLLNRILRRNSQSNARFFEIPTFLVLPLEEERGVIEMLPNCETYRSISEKLYAERIRNFKVNCLPIRNKEAPVNEFVDAYSKVVKRLQPPVLPLWFLRKYTEPTSWYMARLAYTRSSAVVSMGGYIIGLGDRHLDNILFDTHTGRVVHVDFNLLFHQGELLPYPERVPFRLSHNLVAAFGPMGTEGNFRKVCEITMHVMRKEKEALLTTLKPLVHDPCSDWTRDKNKLDPDERHSGNSSAKSKIEIIERKLKGFPRSKKFKPLNLLDSYSVEAQVDNLIEEATDIYNLSQMYHGWCPHV